MTLSMVQWHQRYRQQARWTQNLRKYIYEIVGIDHANKVLDIGCGTGVLEKELNDYSSLHVFGLDIDIKPLYNSQGSAPKSKFTNGDCLHLPYQTGVFDVTFCHFLLLWVKEPFKAVKEMLRVTRPRGFILALAEPDYGGRIDFPIELAKIGGWQIEALKNQGANPFIGRELRSIFSRVGLINIEVGILGGQWGDTNDAKEFELEWEVINSDLRQNDEYRMQADELITLDRASREAHQRILYMPTFYAFGMVSG